MRKQCSENSHEGGTSKNNVPDELKEFKNRFRHE